MTFERFHKETLDTLRSRAQCTGGEPCRLFIAASGYETRASYWAKQVHNDFVDARNLHRLALSFSDKKDVGARATNDEWYRSAGYTLLECSSDCESAVAAAVREQIVELQEQHPDKELEIHIDYSSMPRRWYCSLFLLLHSELQKKDSFFMWYSGGWYEGTEFPTAGVSDIKVFSGRPTLTPKVRTHIFGLGFDLLRAAAIFRVLDPQSLICFYAAPGVRQEYEIRVTDANRDLLAAARHEFCVAVDDFPETLSKIADVVRDSARLGDVILVPDGPKPLVLASSLIPNLFGVAGIVSLHVRRRKDLGVPWLDVKPTGQVFGFSIAGSKE